MNKLTFKIAESLWEICIVPVNSPELLVDGASCNGATWFTLQKIYISSDVPKQSAKRVIVHELVHAYIYATQMRIPDKLTEEEVCDFFGCWGYSIIETADWLFERLYCSIDRIERR